jgi:hypothetical protein
MCINGVSEGWVALLGSAMLRIRCNTGVNALKLEENWSLQECLRMCRGLVLNRRVTFLNHEAEPKASSAKRWPAQADRGVDLLSGCCSQKARQVWTHKTGLGQGVVVPVGHLGRSAKWIVERGLRANPAGVRGCWIELRSGGATSDSDD